MKLTYRKQSESNIRYNCRGMNFANPITKNSKKTTYFKLMEAITAEPGHFQYYYVEKVFGRNAYKGLLNSYFSGFSFAGFTKNSYEKGLIPTTKLAEYIVCHR